MRKLNVMIVAGLIVAVVGAAVVILYGRSVDNRIADGKKQVTVLVADQFIPVGQPAEALTAYVHPKQIPSAYAVDQPLSSLSNVSGKFTSVVIGKDGQLSAAFFSDTATSTPGAVQLQSGNVAIAIQVGLTPGVAKYVSPGSRVDMFVTYGGAASKGGRGSSGSETKLFASGVHVLSVTPASTSTDTTSSSSQAQVSPGDDVIAVVQASPDLAQKIVNATTLGSVYLGLDAAGDVHVTRNGATPGQVLNSHDIVRPRS